MELAGINHYQNVVAPLNANLIHHLSSPLVSVRNYLACTKTASVINADVMDSLQAGIGCGFASAFIERGHGLFPCNKDQGIFI